MRACFDKNGFLLWTLRGDMEVECDPGQAIVEVDDDADANSLFFADGNVVEREMRELVAPRLMLTGHDDRMTIEGLPDPVWLSVDGKPRLVTGGTFEVARARRIEMCGPYRSNAIDIGYQTWADAAQAVRTERDARLAASDWTMAPDAKVDRDAWAAYRDALRDLPANQPRVTLDTVEWPIAPS